MSEKVEVKAPEKHECDMCGLIIVVNSNGEMVNFENFEESDGFELDQQVGEEFGLHRVHHLTEELTPGDITLSGHCPLCRTACYPVEPGDSSAQARLDAAEKVLLALVSTIDNTGGVVAFDIGTFEPVGARDWVDLGDVYNEACKALRRQPVIAEHALYESEKFADIPKLEKIDTSDLQDSLAAVERIRAEFAEGEDLGDGRTRTLIEIEPVTCGTNRCVHNTEVTRQAAVYSDLPERFCPECDFDLGEVITIGCYVDNGTDEIGKVIAWADPLHTAVVVDLGDKQETWDCEAIEVAEEDDSEADTECLDCGSKWDGGAVQVGIVCPVCHRGTVTRRAA